MVVDSEGEEPVVTSAGALRVAGRFFQGTERWLTNHNSDGRIAVARLIGYRGREPRSAARPDGARNNGVHPEGAGVSCLPAAELVPAQPTDLTAQRPSGAARSGIALLDGSRAVLELCQVLPLQATPPSARCPTSARVTSLAPDGLSSGLRSPAFAACR